MTAEHALPVNHTLGAASAKYPVNRATGPITYQCTLTKVTASRLNDTLSSLICNSPRFPAANMICKQVQSRSPVGLGESDVKDCICGINFLNLTV